MVELSLARGFPPADEAAWKALVEEALKGAPFAGLRSTSYDGIVIEPLYGRAQDATRVEGRPAGQPWAVMQRIDLTDPKAANAQILDDLMNGASGETLVFQGAIGDYGYALPATGAAISAALDNIYLDAGIAIDLDLSMQSKDAAGLLATLVKARGLGPKDCTIRFGFGPLGGIALNGHSPLPWKDIAPIFAGLVSDLAGQGFAGPFAVADGRVIHAAGGSEAQELAFALASAVAYLRALEQSGIALDDARRFIYFRLAADQDQFLTIAKFRAVRKLWARVEEACGLKPLPVFVAAETAWRMMTKRDPHGNIVRGTIAAFAAAVGGADAVTVLPFSAALGVPDAFARRIARNTQTILIEEANIHRVADPAAGSGAIEALTDALCETAWWFLQRIETAGGVAEALQAGSIQRVVARVRAEREANVARRKDTLVGSSDFPDLGEDKVAVLAQSRLAALSTNAAALGPIRLAEPFERLRDRSDSYLATAWHKAQGVPRLSRPRRRFQRAGEFRQEPVRVRRHRSGGRKRRQPRETIQGIGREARLPLLLRQGLSSARPTDVAKALAEAGAARIYLAGKPADRAALERAGITSFLHQGCDTLQILNVAYDEI